MGDKFKDISGTSGNINIATRGSKIISEKSTPMDQNESTKSAIYKQAEKENWYKRPLGAVFLGVLIIMLGAICIWGVNKITNIGL